MNNPSEMLGMKVRLERTKRKWSQEELAERADLSRAYLGTVERGESSPTLDTIVKLAGAFNIELPKMLEFDF
ncbi:MAG: helix-turn-helix domain-containing protein [Heliobacteriaceae bacterium]|jgi:transcriptional regulator with XRE-family HTH domain|nr:helix-turn-helix domain-containing protein [Heliobacteriaceae bacterium]